MFYTEENSVVSFPLQEENSVVGLTLQEAYNRSLAEKFDLVVKMLMFEDAAEFEARVAKKAVELQGIIDLCEDVCPKISCEWCHLKEARLKVEEEMDREVKERIC